MAFKVLPYIALVVEYELTRIYPDGWDQTGLFEEQDIWVIAHLARKHLAHQIGAGGPARNLYGRLQFCIEMHRGYKMWDDRATQIFESVGQAFLPGHLRGEHRDEMVTKYRERYGDGKVEAWPWKKVTRGRRGPRRRPSTSPTCMGTREDTSTWR